MIEKHKQSIDEEKTPAVTSNVDEVLDLLNVTTNGNLIYLYYEIM